MIYDIRQEKTHMRKNAHCSSVYIREKLEMTSMSNTVFCLIDDGTYIQQNVMKLWRSKDNILK